MSSQQCPTSAHCIYLDRDKELIDRPIIGSILLKTKCGALSVIILVFSKVSISKYREKNGHKSFIYTASDTSTWKYCRYRYRYCHSIVGIDQRSARAEIIWPGPIPFRPGPFPTTNFPARPVTYSARFPYKCYLSEQCHMIRVRILTVTPIIHMKGHSYEKMHVFFFGPNQQIILNKK